MLTKTAEKVWVLLLVLITLVALLNTSNMASSIGISKLNITIIYDPTLDYGIAVYTLKLDTVLNDLSMIKIPLINGDSINIVSVTDDQGAELLYKYDNLTNEIEVLANNTDLVNITYEIRGLFQEIGVGAYIAYIDVSAYNDTETRVEIDLLGNYNIYVEPSNADIVQGKALTIIILNTPTQYVIVAEESLSITTTTTTVQTQTQTSSEKTMTTLETTPTKQVTQPESTTTRTTTTVIVSTTSATENKQSPTTTMTETHMTTPLRETTSYSSSTWLLGALAVIIIIGIFVIIKKK